MAMLLPQGIVVNSDQINQGLESIALQPLDPAQIAELWKVYTTTRRRLLDPTAERLENYWWRIWYSDKKSLHGITVARLFDHISNGPTFVPLRGPPNRIESLAPPNKSIHQHGPGAASATALHRPGPAGESISSGTTTTVSSVSRAPVPMPPPILKKTRGPSASGPRPTARFISPHHSEHEGDGISSVGPSYHLVVHPPSPDPLDGMSDKKATATRKRTGFLATTKKKRPVIVRQQSSHTSQSSADATAKQAEAAQAAAETRSPLDAPPAKTQVRFQENYSPSPDRSGADQMPKNQPVNTKRSSQRNSGARGRTTPSQASEEAASTGEPGPSTQLRRVENLQEQQGEEEVLTAEELEEVELQRTILAEGNARLQRKAGGVPERRPQPKPPRSQPAVILESSGFDAMRLVQHDAKGTPSLAPTLAAATGQVALGEVGTDQLRSSSNPAPSWDHKGKGRATDEPGQFDLFAKRPVQLLKPASAMDSLSRCQSQLTLLLKQDQEKNARNEREFKRIK